MTIRRLLLVAFLLVSLVPTTAVTLLAFERTRQAMLGEIQQGVRRSATSAAADLDRMLFERMINATTWNHLEVMQDLRLNDVDKRLSNFLAEMKRRYGDVYLDLLAVDTQGRVIASSAPRRIGGVEPPMTPWMQAQLAGGPVTLDLPDRSRMTLRSQIDSQFTQGQLGQLVLEIDRGQIERALDGVSDRNRQVLVLDGAGRLVAASALLRSRGAEPGMPLQDWLPPSQTDLLETRKAAPWFPQPVLIGVQRSRGFQDFQGSGWTTLLLQSRAAALMPVQSMAWHFAGLLAATVVATVLASLWVAGRLADPIIALTQFVRRYTQPGAALAPPAPGPGEIGELNRSFVGMVEALQQSQATLMQASKLAALGEVTALMAHEIRTPLGILRSSAQMLRVEPALSAEGHELTEIMQSEVERLNRLVSSMLDSARTRPPQRHPQDLHALIEHAAALLAAQCRDRKVTVPLQLQAMQTQVLCDAEQITQVLLNLIMNALQVLPEGGIVRIITRDEASRVLVEVRDNGPGIAIEDRARIFEPFVFKREGGIGLGLAVVRQILRQHGGDVVVDENLPRGAVFRWWLPTIEEGGE